MDKDRIEGKAELLVDYEDRATLFDCLILCRFFRDFILWDELQMLIEATTGLRLDKEGLQEAANSITNLTREFNTREGLDSASDRLPKRFFEKNAEGAVLSGAEMQTMIDAYNRIRQRENPSRALA